MNFRVNTLKYYAKIYGKQFTYLEVVNNPTNQKNRGVSSIIKNYWI